MRLQFTAENLVCEVPYLPRRVEFTWYEMDADRTPAHIWRSQDPIAARVIAMTMRSASVGSRMIVCSPMPPAPGIHCGPVP